MTRIRPGISTALVFAACTGPEPTAQVPDWLRPAEERVLEPLSEKPGDPRWLVLPALAQCDATIAAAPAAVGLDLVWRPCPGGQVGCRALLAHDDELVGSLLGPRMPYQLLAGWTASGVMLAIYEANGGPEREHVSLAPLDGPPFLVLDLQSRGGACSFLRADFSETSATIVLTDNRSTDAAMIYLRGPLHADPAWHRPLASDARSWRTITATIGGEKLSYDGFAVGTSTVALADGKIRAAVTPGAPPVLLHPRSGGGVLADLQLQGGALYWAEGVRHTQREGFDSVELWTAPATDEPARFAPRRIAALDLHALPGGYTRESDVDELVIGGGKIAVRHTDVAARTTRVTVVDVATGERRMWLPGADVFTQRLLFVSPDELGVTVSVGDKYAYMRIRHDALVVIAGS